MTIKGSDFYFCIASFEDMDYEETLVVVLKKFWDDNKYLQDRFSIEQIKWLHTNLGQEDMEACWIVKGRELEGG